MKKIILQITCTFATIVMSLITVYGSNPTASENDSTSDFEFSFNADFVSRYIWRGLPLSLNPNIQPYASIGYKNLTLGAWGSYAMAQPYAELDLYLSYDISVFTLTLNDYYNEEETDMALNDYFNFSTSDSNNTAHFLEGSITFNGTDGFPVSVSLNTYFFNDDKYSTYLELGYDHTIGENNLSFFLGGTFGEGMYADKAAVVNIGLTASREIKLFESTSIPVSTSFIINPKAKDVFFVFGLTL